MIVWQEETWSVCDRLKIVEDDVICQNEDWHRHVFLGERKKTFIGKNVRHKQMYTH